MNTMSDGLKIGLVVAGIGAVALYLFHSSSSAAVTAATTTGAASLPQLHPSSPTSPSPGAISAASVGKSVGTVVGSYAAQTGLAFATGGLSLLATTGTGRSIVKGAASGVKSAGVAVYDAGKSVVNAIGSIF